MTMDQETIAIIICGFHPAHLSLYKNATYGSWRWREWRNAMQLANKIVDAGFSSVKF